MMGVPVTPKGSMLPQPILLSATGVPTWLFHTVSPVAASSAYTQFCSVATSTTSFPAVMPST